MGLKAILSGSIQIHDYIEILQFEFPLCILIIIYLLLVPPNILLVKEEASCSTHIRHT